MTRDTHREQVTAGTDFGMDKPMTQKQHDMYFNGLPKALKHWLQYDAMCAYSVRKIYAVYRQVRDANECIRLLKEVELEHAPAYF